MEKATATPGLRPLRPCVGIMVLNEQGKVWVGHRIWQSDGEVPKDAKLWQMPQGGIDNGEQPETAARRELFEETGMESITLLAESPEPVDYELPPELVGTALKGKYRGQSQRWFAFRFTGSETEIRINPPPGEEKAEFDQWQWVGMHTLPDMVVEFKRELYLKVIRAMEHLVK